MILFEEDVKKKDNFRWHNRHLVLLNKGLFYKDNKNDNN